MADTKLADLTALTTPSGDDILYIVDDPAGTPLDRKITLDNLFTRGTITVSSPVIDASQTWNAGGVTFTGLKFNAAGTSDANSASASLLMDLQVGTVSQFKVSKAGRVEVASNGWFTGSDADSGFQIVDGGRTIDFYRDNVIRFRLGSVVTVGTDLAIGATGATGDIFLTRRAAANLRFGAADAAAPVAQTLSVQSGTAGASALTSSISGTTLTVGTVTGTIAVGHAVTGTGVTAGTTIVSGSGSTWIVSASQTVASTTMYFNSVGQNLTLTGSQGSGPSAGGSIVFQVAPAGSAATTAQNALATALTIASDKSTRLEGDLNFSGTGTVNIQGNVNFLFTRSGTYRWGIGQEFIATSSTAFIGFSSSSTDIGGTTATNVDTRLYRDAANTLALRNGTAAQTFNLYGTYSNGGVDYERLSFTSSGGNVDISTEKAGTGVVRPIRLFTTGSAALQFGTVNVLRWNIDTNGHFVANTDNLYDIGASGTSRPRNVYVGTNIISPQFSTNAFGFFTTSGGYINFATRAGFESPVDGVIKLRNAADTDFGRLQFGGTTSSFPAIKRNGAGFDVVGADGTNVSFIRVPGVAVASLPSAATAGVGARSFVTDATATTYASTVAGGGANKVPVFSDGTNWIIG